MALIYGTSGNDVIYDTADTDQIADLDGNDTVVLAANDRLLDTITLGAGDDLVIVEEGTGAAEIRLAISGGNDTIIGNEVDDVSVEMWLASFDKSVTVDLARMEVSTDIRTIAFEGLSTLRFEDMSLPVLGIYVDGRGFAQDRGLLSVFTGEGADTVVMGSADLFANLREGDDLAIFDEAAGTVAGGDGDDIVDFSQLRSSIALDVTTGKGTSDGQMFQAQGFETVHGTGFDDLMTASDTTQDVTLDGGTGDDSLEGSYGDDGLYGGVGDDLLQAGKGDDVLSGGAGDDTMLGGDGLDRATYEDAAGRITVNLSETGAQFTGAAGWDTLIDIENIDGSDVYGDRLIGSTGDNMLRGFDGNNALFGLGGADTLLGGRHSDTLYGGDGQDRLFALGGRDLLDGGAAADMLWGLGGADTLRGGTGSDTLVGGGGQDILIGGTVSGRVFAGDGQADVFEFQSLRDSRVGSTHDIIRDFEVAHDVIFLNGIGAVSFVGGTSGFSGAAGDVFSKLMTDHTLVWLDINGDHDADFEIRLDGLHVLTAANFDF
ncbi:calcium-binding protein [Tropicibacter naphthalenivorans]|uniref:Poly(Beta-D-mannuronate) C5 epimerase 2 n=1 Tax=Tropicibacter naphthalenivorans TaxID=441103 RepID=A0A0P1GRY9_9RHOB|nr:calcium-binding protein [Tropicibacter naphthalenivorans]CUH77358.1 Poly(beta-D-mannuronate) C5 epimerase 2 [Tropicibacter naphthalenivorans]SMC58735.1 Hemolysin-type calcium-binding repeat-containing protein [Tropicibacter naphthalenivorans]